MTVTTLHMKQGKEASESKAVTDVNVNKGTDTGLNDGTDANVHKATDTWLNGATDANVNRATELKEKYRDYMSDREYVHFDMFSLEERFKIVSEAKARLQTHNLDRIRGKTIGKDFLGTVSHELRTPLNGLIGVIDLMQSEEMTESQRLYIKTLEQSCTHLLSVVNRMQDLAALHWGDPFVNIMPFDIVASITGVAESMQHMSRHTGCGTQVALDLDPELPLSVNGDLTKIGQILANLVSVATLSSHDKYATLKATFEPLTGKDARIHITIKGIKTQTPRAMLEGFDMDFSFEDLMQPVTSNNMSQGIVICREFLVQMGSDLDMEIDEDDTLIFRFALNVTYDKTAVARDQEGELEAARSSVKILVAEDNKVNRMVAKAMLSKLGFVDVDDAEDGQGALDKLEKKEYDVILMDCDMPVMDGYEATHHIRTTMKNTTIKILALTANSTNEARQKCITAGMDDYFTKPITMKTLAEMLHKWLPTTDPPKDSKTGKTEDATK
ncbi:hypothetical protein HKX48_001132 [Thoreauomyces humboldtii]|nr:hypothetical protein HKX48_001132 [Thoreauomyces humboldtii]